MRSYLSVEKTLMQKLILNYCVSGAYLGEISVGRISNALD
jgi:hypothetical protein